ncbi:MAG: pyridoxal phosphate-dependent aminotransferase [Gemmatimonadaceae bacterium]
MFDGNGVTRRGFVGGMASAMVGGYLGVRPRAEWMSRRGGEDPYDLLAKLHYNENPYGPPESVLKAMTQAFKYANRYGYPDGDIVQTIAKHHGLAPEQVVLGAGSGEILDVMGSAFASSGKKVLGVAPSYDFVYSHVSSVMGASITLPLTADYRQDIPALLTAAKRHYREIGFVYICNPNNPTGRIVTKDEIKQLLDGLPEDMPVLIDEAYHHFVEDPSYATSVPYVAEGRPVIVTRTFSKIAALAGMRLGYGLSQPEIIRRIEPYVSDSINAVVKWGGVAALKDTASEAHVKKVTLDLRKQTTSELSAMGYTVVPSETNFFMVHLQRRVEPVIKAFETRGVLVGRPFPPMYEYLRVSVGNADEMRRFTVAFKEIMSVPA